MGKKKVGKHRKDKYYHLAKESGYRSRASFKLIQLNRKYEFLQQSQVLVDLCAAPGGWMQVAAQYMPVSSLLIGVDLFPIQPIGNALTIVGDITSDSTKKAIERELKTLLADCVLHDGAPNVGANWLHDAFAQAELVLAALKLATQLLKRGGWFITKVFRSKDYPALLPVFSKLFKKVLVTKPQASRSESAEIFVICKGYLKPAQLDKDLLDSRKVFSDTTVESVIKGANQLIPKKKAKAEGYEEGDYTLHHKLPVSDFLTARDFLNLLAKASEIVFDVSEIASDPRTTEEIKEFCKDVKLLGRRELKQLFTWRKEMQKLFKKLERDRIAAELAAAPAEDKLVAEVEPVEPVDEEARKADAKKAQEELAMREARRAEKRKRKKEFKDKRRMRDKVQLQMVIPGDQPDVPEDAELFSLKRTLQIKEDHADSSSEESQAESDLEDDLAGVAQFLAKTKKHSEDGNGEDPEADEKEPVEDFDDGEMEVVELEGKQSEEASLSDFDSDSDREYEIGDIAMPTTSRASRLKSAVGGSTAKKANIDDGEPSDKRVKLDPLSLALGEVVANSKKGRRDLEEWAFNRYANNDDNLPDWFVEDEKKHFRPNLPVTKMSVKLQEQVSYYRQLQKDINVRPIKKVMEAKARKKKLLLRRVERAKKKASSIAENEGLSEKEKASEIRRISKAVANRLKKPPVKYVMAKKTSATGRRVKRPAGVEGRFKVVDKRQKSDKRGEQKRPPSGGSKKGGKTKTPRSYKGRRPKAHR